MTYKIGDIFEDDEEYSDRVLWADKNGATIVPLSDGKFQLVELSKPSLADLKAQKRAEINKARDKAEQSGFEYLGKTFDSYQVSCIRISSAAQAMQYAPDDATITWTTQDNSTIDLNKSQVSGLVVALAQHSNECHQKATALKAQIDACDSKEALDKIKWE